MNYGENYSTLITLFDDADDDIFDGTFGQDDDEEPMIKTMFNLTAFTYQPNASPSGSPRRTRKGRKAAEGSVDNSSAAITDQTNSPAQK